jgi:hypothetical protein
MTVWIGYCGTGGKPAGNCENKLDPVAVRESSLLDFRRQQAVEIVRGNEIAT